MATGSADEDPGDFSVVEFAGETVRGEHVEISGLDCVGDDVGFGGGLRANGAGDDVADGGTTGLIAAEETGADLFFDQRVIFRDEFEGVGAESVTAAVTDMGDPEGGAGDVGGFAGWGFFEQGGD